MNSGIPSELRTPGSKVKHRLVAAPLAEPLEPAGRVAQFLNVALAVGICLLLAFEPLALGGVQYWGIFVLEAGAALLLMTWAARGIAMRRLEIAPNPLFTPMLLFAGLVAAQLLLARTAYWYATWQMALLWAAYGIVVFLMAQSFRRTVWLRRLGIFFTVFGFLVAVCTVAQQFAGNGKIYWVIPNQSGWPSYGPYIDHSHYAGLMEMLVPIPLVFSIADFFRKPVRVLFGFAALIMGSTIFLSQSRGGIVAFVAELVVLAILLARRGHAAQQLALLGLLCILLGSWLVMLHPTGLGSKLATLQDPLGKAGAGDRLTIVRDSFKMMRQRPLLGWGLGTFPMVYPSFRSFYTNLLINEAHNDFVQFAVETGILGCAVMIAFLTLLYRRVLRRIEHWRRDPRASMALAALVGCSGLLVHSISDFNLQIPSNALLFFTLAAIAMDGEPLEHRHRLSRS